MKHRQPKAMPSHTVTLLEESSVVEMTKQADTHQADRPLSPCPEDGCVKSYMMHRRLEQHLMYGKYEFRMAESLSLLDRAKISYAERLEAGGSHSEVTITGSEMHFDALYLPEGWAGWDHAKPRHRFNSKQTRYLMEKFQHGETTRVKASPQDVSKEMRCLRDENGKRIFTVEAFLHPNKYAHFSLEWHLREEKPPTLITRQKNLSGSRRLSTRM